jgi:hypothetical protein
LLLGELVLDPRHQRELRMLYFALGREHSIDLLE